MANKEIEPDNLAICPNCGHKFDYKETFCWLADEDGHPTVEGLQCPKCSIGTSPLFSCSNCPGGVDGKYKCDLEEECAACASVNYDDFFKEVTNGK